MIEDDRRPIQEEAIEAIPRCAGAPGLAAEVKLMTKMARGLMAFDTLSPPARAWLLELMIDVHRRKLLTEEKEPLNE